MPVMLLAGDVNLMNVGAQDRPLRLVTERLTAADFAAANLECSLHTPAHGHAIEHEGFFVDPDLGGAILKESGFDVFGIANNVNYGETAILGSIGALDRSGIRHAGAGKNLEAARKPVIVESGGVRYGFLQRSSVYWSTNHEAGETGVGIAVIRGHTAYHVPMYREGSKTAPFNRPGIPPLIITWADAEYLERFREDIRALRTECDVLVASCHWGLSDEVFTYMREIAHAAIDAGADVVMGHGPHRPLPTGFYQGKPIFYGLGSFSFHTGHLGIKHGDWIGLLARLEFDDPSSISTSFSFVRHNDDNETLPCTVREEAEPLAWLTKHSKQLGADLIAGDERVEMLPF